MNSNRIIVDARATQAGFKQHKHRGIGQYAKALIEEFTARRNIFRLAYLYDTDKELSQVLRVQDVVGHENLPLPGPFQYFAPQFTLPRGLGRERASLVHYLAHEDAALATPGAYVVTVHDTIRAEGPRPASKARALAHLGVQALAGALVRRARAVITDSQSTKNDVMRIWRVSEERVTVVHLATSERFYKAHSAEELASLRHRFDLPERFFLYVGGIDPRKNLDRLCEALATLTRERGVKVPLVIAGDITKQLQYPALQKKIRDLGIAKWVKLIGFVADDDMPALYAASSVFVFPSLYEGFGIPPLEAMASGTPVVAGTSSSIPEVTGEAALSVDVTSPKAIAEAMQEALTHLELRARLQALGRRQANLFSWRKTAEQTLAVYERVLEKRPLA